MSKKNCAQHIQISIANKIYSTKFTNLEFLGKTNLPKACKNRENSDQVNLFLVVGSQCCNNDTTTKKTLNLLPLYAKESLKKAPKPHRFTTIYPPFICSNVTFICADAFMYSTCSTYDGVSCAYCM